MKTVSGQEFVGIEVQIDNTEFIDCKFTDCAIVYRGAPYHFRGCEFAGVSFKLRDAALWTAKFMQGFGMLGDKRLIHGNDSNSPS
jgi:hypothetical protein